MTKEGGGTSPQKSVAQLQADAQGDVDDLRAAIAWMKNPANVPGGVDVVFANNYEFTDGTGDVASCPGASVSGIEPWQDKQAQTAFVVWFDSTCIHPNNDGHAALADLFFKTIAE